MNIPPQSFIRVSSDDLFQLTRQIGVAAGLTDERATLLADVLTANDLRGVFSHGTTQIATYARLMREGSLNPRPDVHIVQETPTSVLMDGDGGLGYFPSYEGTLLMIEKAKASGIAIAVTRNHGHFGAAGIYSRLTLPHDLLCYVTSGHQLHLHANHSVFGASGGSPMSFSAPAGEEESLVLDFGAVHDINDEVIRHAPGIVFRSIGMGMVCQTWGGFLAGVPVDPARANRTFSGANQGSLIMAFRIDLFMESAAFKREMDEYVRTVRTMRPVPGYSDAYVPGGLEAARSAEYRRDGVPVGEHHRQRLTTTAHELGITVPWE